MSFLNDYRDEILAFIVAMALFGLLYLATGCAWLRAPVVKLPDVVKPPTAETLAPSTTGERTRVESAESEVSRLKGELKSAEDKVETARAHESEARLAGVRTLVTWLTAICVLVGILSVGAFVFLRIKSLLLVTAACAAMVITAQASTVLLNHPLMTASALATIIGGVVAAIWAKQSITNRGLLAAVSFGQDAIKAITPEAIELTKIKHAALQDASGIRSLIQSVRATMSPKKG